MSWKYNTENGSKLDIIDQNLQKHRIQKQPETEYPTMLTDRTESIVSSKSTFSGFLRWNKSQKSPKISHKSSLRSFSSSNSDFSSSYDTDKHEFLNSVNNSVEHSSVALNEYIYQALEDDDVIQLRSLDGSLIEAESAYRMLKFET